MSDYRASNRTPVGSRIVPVSMISRACADLLAVLDATPTGPLTDVDRPD
ncbi:MAG TPA: hypothetical protein VJ851_02665 [Jatrophihabitans sp.]|nr:hypothetical protein [Jatrophihabitans sp.]